MKIYGIKNCQTVQKAISFLNDKKIQFEFIDFKKQKPNPSHIKLWKQFWGSLPVNKQGTTYKKFKDQYEKLSDDQKVEFICENPSLIKRPVLENKGKVLAIGFSDESYQQLF